MNVDLPAPFGPNTPKNSPELTLTFKGCNAIKSPYLLPKSFATTNDSSTSDTNFGWHSTFSMCAYRLICYDSLGVP